MYQEIDPTVANFEIVRGSGDPGYNGTLDMKIPLMKIPGTGGLDFNLDLIYVNGNGVPASESESWVGLGWNLNMYQIVCSPAFAEEPYLSHLGSTGQDLYYLACPGISTPIYRFEDDQWRPLNWSAIKIESVDDPNPSDAGWAIDKDYKKFIVTDVNGTRYIFEHRLRMDSEVPLRNHCNWQNSHQSNTPSAHSVGSNHPYYYVFKLTAILGANYIDGSTTPDEMPGNSEGIDRGDWIKLDYSTIQTVSGIGEPTHNLKTETSYLWHIATPTHIATFEATTDPTECSRFIYQGWQYGYLNLLKTIQLNPTGTTVEFSYTRQFAWAKRFVDYSSVLVKQEGGVNGDKLRAGLNSVQISSGGEHQPAYKFEYYDNPDEVHGAACYRDPWGYYSNQSPANGQTNYTWGCWLLKKVTYPTGGTVEFEFESNRYQTYGASSGDEERIGGGVRLIKQTLKDNAKNPDLGNTYTTTYEYSLTNTRHPKCGFVSLVPVIYQFGGLIQNGGVAKNLRTDVHYPDIQITQPDGSRICRYYTCAFSDSDGPYDTYYRSYSNVTVDADIVLNSIDISSNTTNPVISMIYTIFNLYNELNITPNTSYSHFTTPNTRYTTNIDANGKIHENNAFRGEASEFGDKWWGVTSTNYNPIFDNSWKRGYLTHEEFYNDGSDYPIQEKVFHLTMTPMRSEMFQYRSVTGGIGGPLAIGVSPGFVTSGWVKQSEIDYYSHPYVTYYTNPQLMKKEIFEYNVFNGLVSKKTVESWITSAKKQIEFHTYICDLPEIYPEMRALHMWNQEAFSVVGDQTSTFSTMLTGNQLISSLTQTQWQNYNGMWLPNKILKWKDLNGNNNYDASDDNITSQEFISYNDKGNPIEFRDANGSSTSVKWGYNSSRPIATFVNGKSNEAFYDNFETQSGWEGPMQYSNDSHTGEYCGVINNSGSSEMVSHSSTNLTISLSAVKKFRYSAWVYSDGPSVDIYLFMKRAGETAPYTYIDFVQTTTINQWVHLEGKCNVPADVVTLNLRLDNNGGGMVLFDDAAIYSFDALMYTGTYYPGSLLLKSVTDANGNPKRFEYDGFQRLRNIMNCNYEKLQEYDYELVGELLSVDRLNYIVTNFYRSGSEKTTSVEYFNGLGRKVQTQTALGTNDLVSAITYDDMGRIARSYKPYQIDLGANAHIYDPVFHVHSKNYYNLTLGITSVGDFPYSETVYLQDPLNRPRYQGSAGDAFKIGSGRETEFEYNSNFNELTVLKKNENDKTISTTTDHLGNIIRIVTDPNDLSEPPYYDTGLNLKTTFEYDIHGNLLKSIPPKGNVNGGDPVATATTYTYNTLSQLTQKTSPDAGTVKYLYDKNGNLRFSQDAKQAPNKFTYQKYDVLNRLIEVGEYNGSAAFMEENAVLHDFPQTADANKSINKLLHYDSSNPSTDPNAVGQRNLNGRLSCSEAYRSGLLAIRTSYSYDEMGRVEWIVQYNSGGHAVKLTYAYDLQGNVVKKGYISF